LRVSVVVPTRNRKEKLLRSLDALTRQSILPQEFEVIVVDDGSTDGTGDAVAAVDFPFALSYYRQDAAGPGAARNLAIAKAAGEFVLFIGDDILADTRLLEEHLLAHAAKPAPGVAVLGHIDWPDTMPRNAVMEYVCGDAALQFGYSLIPTMSWLDHPFFYTSNISVKRQFLLDAADAGIRFDSDFRRAAFEDSEFAARLMPRGLEIRYAERARAFHDHPMDLDSFAARELAVGEMAVVFYRKHPANRALQVRWLAGLNRPVDELRAEPDFLRRLEAFDAQSDTLLRALAGSLEELLAIAPRLGGEARSTMAADQLRPALANVLRVIFDVQRTRGKVREWFSTVDDPAKIRAAETLSSVRRKIELLDRDAHQAGLLAPLDAQASWLRDRIDALDGGAFTREHARSRRLLSAMLRRFGTNPAVLPRLRAADRFLHERLQDHPGSLGLYRRARRRLRALF
jgi:glycosyltransferase involved in cell wall biosynthesis